MDDLFSLARRDRDAWAAIRGYVYQVDTTILRWLRLRAGEVLELECGEDVDLLAPSIIDGEPGAKRTMEQIKCLDRSFTLRSQCSRRAFVALTEHMQENPTLPIQFRFVTTAVPSHERPPLPLTFTPGVMLWQQIRAGQIEEVRRVQSIESIAAFLQLLGPDSANVDGWNQFIAITHDQDRFADFISRFEWSVGASGAEEMTSEIAEALLRQGRATDNANAKARHDQLFAFTMRILARRKSDLRKRLDLNDLDACLASGEISASERRLLGELSDLRSIVVEGLSDVRGMLSGIKQDTELIRHRQLTGASDHDEPVLHAVVDEGAVRDAFRAASSALLSWPREISGQWLERPELTTIESAIESSAYSCSVLLGVPGCGKSALLAQLGLRLEAEGMVLLALKTDQLPNNIERLEHLDAYVGAKTSIVDSVKEIAVRERVVLLIDQLDALASLMDQNTNRLSVVLQLVYRLKSLANVHLLISCREFDFRYDSRFCSLKAAKVHLSEPPWDAVQSFLDGLSIPTAKWPADMREMLRNPQHLSVVVENFAAESIIFESYQNMLEAMFIKRVVNVSDFTSLAVEACERIASEMGDAEELWIPRISMDKQFPREVDRLISAGILKLERRKIGFRHQTLFDYVRTRAFCTGTQSLSGYVLERQDAIFVRSTLWASLHALRSSSLVRYYSEMGRLWQDQTLRRHLRLMLINFLGQVNEPDDREAQWLLPALEAPFLRGKILGAVVGNPGWFRRLQSRLPTLMNASDDVTLWQAAMILQAALVFDSETVFRLMSRHWSEPSCDDWVLQTLRDLSDWDDQATGVVEPILARQAIQCYFVVHLAQRAAKAGAGFGARLVAASLRGGLKRAVDAIEATPKEPTTGSDESDDVIGRLIEWRQELAPIRQLIDTRDWHGLEEVASVEPGAFVLNIWPLFVQIAAKLSDRENRHTAQYRAAREIELDGDIGGRHGHIPQALKIAMGLFAEQGPDVFLNFTAAEMSSELMVAHRLMACGFERLAAVRPDAVLDYLIGDPRRLSLGGYDDRHKETTLLIAAVSRQLSVSELAPLEHRLLGFRMEGDRPGDDPDLRRHRRRWNREHRLRLLRAFPPDRLSAQARKLRGEEEIALPGTTDYDHRVQGGFIGSPVSSEQMVKAADRDIVNLFDELRDRTTDSHPRDFLRGGTYEASQAFAGFAKEQPGRAIAIIESLEPGTQEQPAAHAFYTLAESERVDPHAVVDLIKRLAKRGFSSVDFRDSAAWSMQKLAVRCHGLDDEGCALLKSWLTPVGDDQPDEPKERDVSKQPHSLLWGLGGGGTLPHGNYPVLSALGLAYRCRISPEVDHWLDVLSGHLAIAEHLVVWRTLISELWVLQYASDRVKVVDFLGRLFTRYRRALTCYEGTIFLARSHHWLPMEFLQRCLQALEESDWPWKEQAIGEIAMLRVALVPSDEVCRSIVDVAVASTTPSSLAHSSDLRRVGIAFACINMWNEPKYRQSSHEVLVELVRAANGYLPAAIMDLFRVAEDMPPDKKTKELLEMLAANPELIRRGGPSFLTDRLKELLSAGFDVVCIAETIKALLTAIGPAVGDVRTGWATDAGDLIQMSVALQRNKSSRGIGLAIFETLMDAGAYEADQVLRDLDRRF